MIKCKHLLVLSTLSMASIFTATPSGAGQSTTPKACYDMSPELGGPPLDQMPAVCPALLKALNASCGVPLNPNTLAVSKSVPEIRLAKWKIVPLDSAATRLLEKLVRSRYSVDIPPLVETAEDGGFKYRADQEWEIVSRALSSARQQKQSIVFERAIARFADTDRTDEVYRVRIAKPEPNHSTTKSLGFVAEAVLNYGWMPEYYVGAAADTMKSGQRAPDRFQADDARVLIGQTELINYNGITSAAQVLRGDVHLSTIQHTAEAGPFLSARNVCEFKNTLTSITERQSP
jgi:hypothetical protein